MIYQSLFRERPIRPLPDNSNKIHHFYEIYQPDSSLWRHFSILQDLPFPRKAKVDTRAKILFPGCSASLENSYPVTDFFKKVRLREGYRAIWRHKIGEFPEWIPFWNAGPRKWGGWILVGIRRVRVDKTIRMMMDYAGEVRSTRVICPCDSKGT